MAANSPDSGIPEDARTPDPETQTPETSDSPENVDSSENTNIPEQSETTDCSQASDSSESPEQELDPIETLTAERDDLRDQLLRTRAEMDNVRKRMNRERDEERKYAALPIVKELLPVMDNLQRALDAGQRDHNVDDLLQGVQMVARQIEEVLTQHGLKAIPAVGLPFDPNLHEALQQVPTDEHPPMTVVQEYERGYQLHERVVRPSKVIVATAPPESKSSD